MLPGHTHPSGEFLLNYHCYYTHNFDSNKLQREKFNFFTNGRRNWISNRLSCFYSWYYVLYRIVVVEYVYIYRKGLKELNFLCTVHEIYAKLFHGRNPQKCYFKLSTEIRKLPLYILYKYTYLVCTYYNIKDVLIFVKASNFLMYIILILYALHRLSKAWMMKLSKTYYVAEFQVVDKERKV